MPADVASSSPKIGVVSTTVNPPISVTNAAGQTRTVNNGDPIFLNDTINTPSRSYIKITLNDGTVFQLGPLAKAKLEKYSYISPSEGGEFEASIFTGFFRFVSGKISGDNQGQHTTLKTPAATIGIRGSEIDGSVNEDGSLSLIHVSGLVDVIPHFASEPISAYERGTRIFIDNNHSVVSNVSESEYKQFRDTLSPLDPNVHNNLLFVPPPMSIEPPPAPQDFEKLQKIELSPQEKSLNLAEMSQQQHPEASMIRMEGIEAPPEQIYNVSPLIKNPILGQIGERTPNYQLFEPKEDFLQDRVKDSKVLKDESQVISVIPRKPTNETPVDNTNNTFPEDNAQTTEQIKDELQDVPPKLIDETPTDNPNDAFPVDNSQSIGQILDGNNAPKGGIDVISMSGNDSSVSIALSELLKNDSDVENDPLRILAVNIDENNTNKLSVSLNNDIVNVQLANGVKAGQFSYVLSDGQLETIVPVQVVRTGEPAVISNHAPIANNDTRTLGSLASLTLTDLLDNDIDSDGDRLSILSVSNVSNGTVTLLDTGTVIFNRSADFLSEGGFSYTITDGQGNTAQASVTLTGSALVAASALADIVQSQEPKGSTTAIDVATLLANDTGQNLQVIAVENADNGSVSLQDNKVNFTSLSSAGTQGSFIYTIRDANGNISKATVTVQLTDSSHVAPVAQADSFSVAKNASLQFTLSDLLKNDTGTGLNATINSSSLTGGSLTQVGTDSFTFTPTANFTGNASFNYSVTDSSGASSSATVSIAVQNTPPVAVNDTQTTAKNGTLTIPIQTLLSNDSDANGDNLTLSAVSNAVNGNVRLNGDNVIFVPTNNFVGDASFSYTLQDSSQATATATVNITVTAQETVQAVDDALNTQKNTALNIPTSSLLINDISGNNSTLKIIAADNAINGTVSFDSQQDKLIFTPATNFLGNASFTYTVADTQGNHDTGQVNIKILNNAPIAVMDAFTTQVTNSITIPYSTLLSNDTDADKDTLTVTTVDSARNGIITLGLNEVIFRPSADAANTIGGFSYTITDGTDTATTTVNIQIDANNQAPVAQNDEIKLSYGTTVLVPTYELLKNDTDANPLDTLSVSKIPSTRANVSATLSGDSIEVFVTPQFNSDGTLQAATFNYLASDGTTTSNSALVNLLADNVIEGTRANDSFTPQASQIITGLAGNDTFNGVQANNILHGNAGNDLFLFEPNAATGAVVAGDAGTDTLKLSSNLLNLSQNSILPTDQQYQLTGIDVIDLSNTSGSTASKQLVLSASDVLNISDDNILTILGDSSSIVNSIGYGWQKSDTLVSSAVDTTQRFVSYTKDSATLLVDSDISAQFIS